MKTSTPVIQPIALEIDEDADHLVADDYLLHALSLIHISEPTRLLSMGDWVVVG